MQKSRYTEEQIVGSLDGHRTLNPQSLDGNSGAAFGATLYRDLVLFGATRCAVDNDLKSFILLSLFDSVRGSARQCLSAQNRT
jgi:hypothetical protein